VRAAAALVLLALSACGTNGPPFQRYKSIPDGKGRLYAYSAPSTFPGVGETVSVGDQELATLPAGEYVTVALKPGYYSFIFSRRVGGDLKRRIHIQEGRAVYCGYLPEQQHEKTQYWCTDEKEDHDFELRQCTLGEVKPSELWEP
jgi:hypothetical protein